ncbi:hypothetical protein F7734_03670 [Scytonema sp. UIC 10036]|uniref:hypothetical protein n=1 Tax=Scytonema sp. UIC 10036 TaxID=2304196 RepID=UPI0012DA1807|nr:hypothetical protein [Scytonema sp. UIC 10036]MUG91629.1 hypothetical protein [Scytonema sp. UIC 10036]
MNYPEIVPVNFCQSIVKQNFFIKLKFIDWQAIFLRLMRSDESYKLTLTQIKFAIHRYRLFLFLVHEYPCLKMVPNQEIDTVLHAHIADFNQFKQDCQNLFNAYLTHNPEVGIRGDVERQEWLIAFAHTYRLFEQNFGKYTMGSSIAACCEILFESK